VPDDVEASIVFDVAELGDEDFGVGRPTNALEEKH
jgi:hypothetical protein